MYAVKQPYLFEIAFSQHLHWIPEFLGSGRNCWTLDSGRWTLETGLWTLDSVTVLWTLVDLWKWVALEACFWTIRDSCLQYNSISHNKNLLTGKATSCKNHDDWLQRSFILKTSLFSEVYLEPSWTSLMQFFCKNN